MVLAGLAVSALVLGACGANLSGEPEIVRENEIQSLPTETSAPAATQPSETNAADAESAEPTATEAEASAADVPPAVEGDYDRGFDLFVQNCAICHGAEDGTGPSLGTLTREAATRIEGLSAEEYIYQSITDPTAYVVDGYAPVMPTDFAERLSEQDIRDLVVFVRDFDPAAMGMTSEDGGAASAEGEAENPHADTPPAGEGTVVVRGTVELGTADGDPLPSELPVHLYAVDPHGNIAEEMETTTTEDYTFEFTDVPRAAGMAYFIQIDYQDVPQGTWIPDIEGTEEGLNADVTLYERTTDPDTVAITWAQMLVNYAPIKEFGVEVWLDLEITNTGDRIVTTDQISEHNNWHVSVEIALPPAAFGIQPMQAEGSSRYEVVTEDNTPVVRDTWPLRPGQVHTITVAYYLPYEDGAVFDHIFNYPVVDGVVLLPNDTVEFSSEQFDAEGTWSGHVSHGGVRVTALEPDEEIDPENDFTLVKAHTLLETVPAGESVRFELIGQPTRTIELMPPSHPDTASGSETQTDWLPLVLGAMGGALVMLAVGAWWWQRRGHVAVPAAEAETAADAPLSTFEFELPPKSAGKEELLAALDTLEQAHEAGEIEGPEYREYRAALTERLLPYLNDED